MSIGWKLGPVVLTVLVLAGGTLSPVMAGRPGKTAADDDEHEDQVCICHFPRGRPDKAHTICIGPKAADAHLSKHGDTLGPCETGMDTACCLPDGCQDSVAPEQCRTLGGAPFGLCATCAEVNCPNGVCIGATGSCVEAHPSPGCDSLVCCDQICGNDPFCCEVEWDQQCAETGCAVTGDRVSCCSPERTCGDGASSSGCIGSGGVVRSGGCLGDANGDGVDEACVCAVGDGGVECGRVTCPPGETCCCASIGVCSSGQACPDVECP